MARVKSLEEIQKLLIRVLEQTQALHDKQDEIENPTDASERTVEACEEIEQALGDAIEAVVNVLADITA
jgi:ABC-type transporter Mla subunit MlaD